MAEKKTCKKKCETKFEVDAAIAAYREQLNQRNKAFIMDELGVWVDFSKVAKESLEQKFDDDFIRLISSKEFLVGTKATLIKTLTNAVVHNELTILEAAYMKAIYERGMRGLFK